MQATLPFWRRGGAHDIAFPAYGCRRPHPNYRFYRGRDSRRRDLVEPGHAGAVASSGDRQL
jgi:hypothetical protein